VPDVAGAPKHIVIDRDTVLRRMAFGADETKT
jgi:cytochrome b561